MRPLEACHKLFEEARRARAQRLLCNGFQVKDLHWLRSRLDDELFRVVETAALEAEFKRVDMEVTEGFE